MSRLNRNLVFPVPERMLDGTGWFRFPSSQRNDRFWPLLQVTHRVLVALAHPTPQLTNQIPYSPQDSKYHQSNNAWKKITLTTLGDSAEARRNLAESCHAVTGGLRRGQEFGEDASFPLHSFF